ncbi:MAG: SGNH/GDSL hydrolase family protein [Candidatus Taylorbacteria bacterium]|nr:SGNH/GDSL hydrolase family protein [Candidatus Taylorbacteria bacterium]
MSIVYIFGDSITYGAWDIEKSGWMARLRLFFDDLQLNNPNYYGLFYNLGIPGETTVGLIKRFESETAARGREGEEVVFIFAYGANDAAFLSEENKFRVSKDDFRHNLSEVIKKASVITKKILLINILPVVEAKNISRNGKMRLNKYMQEYNCVVQELAIELNVHLIDTYSVFMKVGHEKLLASDDGLHPNERGHQLMFETIKPIVQEMIGWQ